MFASFRSRLVLSNLLIVLLGLVLVALVFTQLLTQTGVQLRHQELRAQSQNFASQVQAAFRVSAKFQDLAKQVYLASDLLHERIVIASPNGSVVIDSAHRVRGREQLAPLAHGPNVAALHCAEGEVCFRQLVRGTHGHRYGAQVFIVAKPADVSPSTARLREIALIAVSVVLVVWLLIGLYFTFFLFRPLLRITDATRRMARGDYSARVGATGQGEIGQLATSFDEMARQVQQSSQVLKDFLANVSHDLRTPLTMITGFSQALVDGTAQPEDVGSSAEFIHEEALKMQQLVDDLLQLTRLESGLFTLDRHPVDVRAFVQGVLDRSARGHDPAALPSISNQVPHDLALIDADPDRLERALRNLVDNALAYTPPGGQVTVAARPMAAGAVEISVADTGVGIPRDDLPRIFERFYRSDRSRDRGHGHSGLGLAIVREIVEAHGGRVTAESEIGRGTVFRFTIPIARTRPPSPRPEDERTAPARAIS